jgi:glycosyltransferase involved in cell wall biosynthesis
MKILVVLPVYNEETILRENALKLYDFLEKNIKDDWQIVIADNGSIDGTAAIGKTLAARCPEKIFYFYISEKGRGGALKKSWQTFPADFYTFMDADLATDLVHFPQMIDELKNGNDVVVGSRLEQESNVDRSFFRELTSRVFNFLRKKLLDFKIKDSQCGFKGAAKNVITKVLPIVKNTQWFFDTEFLFLAERNGFKIKEIPVRWKETPNKKRRSLISVFKFSSDNIFKISFDYLKEIWQLKNYDRNQR